MKKNKHLAAAAESMAVDSVAEESPTIETKTPDEQPMARQAEVAKEQTAPMNTADASPYGEQIDEAINRAVRAAFDSFSERFADLLSRQQSERSAQAPESTQQNVSATPQSESNAQTQQHQEPSSRPSFLSYVRPGFWD